MNGTKDWFDLVNTFCYIYNVTLHIIAIDEGKLQYFVHQQTTQ